MVPIGSRDFPFDILDVAALLRLNIRRRGPEGVYVDCPICGDKRGKTYLNTVKNVWRCNYCSNGGGMLALYAMVYHISNSEAYQAICDALMTGEVSREYAVAARAEAATIPQSETASAQEIHRTYSAMLSMLTLSAAHREHLHRVRGLSDEDIERFGLKSTPLPFLFPSIANKLIKQGFTVQGVPGFFVDDKGRWTVRFFAKTAGIIIPLRSVDGLICGIQTRLDHPIKDKDDPPEKEGVKYLSLSSNGKNMGTPCSGLVHFVGKPDARVVYVTEGGLKADVANALTGRTFLASIGANNVAPLDNIFAYLKRNGVEEIIEAADMDKYRNKTVNSGASRIYLMARKHGLACRRLVWNPIYKGIDDWQLALRKQKEEHKEEKRMNFKQQYLYGYCGIDHIDECIEEWHTAPENGVSLAQHLGLSDQEYSVFLRNSPVGEFQALLDSQRRSQCFRIYQIDMDIAEAVPYAFVDVEKLHELGYEQPRASDYRLMYDNAMSCPNEQQEGEILDRIFRLFNEHHPSDYSGRSLSVSDVVELYGDGGQKYFYRDSSGFTAIGFSPMLAKPLKESFKEGVQ